MSDLDFDQEAVVVWVPGGRTGWVKEERTFASLRDAIRFVMGELPIGIRATASIKTAKQGHLFLGKIEEEYRRLTCGDKR